MTLPGRIAAARIALAAAIVAASLWDFRVATIRVFDLASLLLICGFFALDPDFKRDWFSRRMYILPLVVVVLLYAGLGYVNFHHRSSFAIALLALVCLQFAGYPHAMWLARVFKWLVYAHVAMLLTQYLAFRVFGLLIDPQELFGTHSRILTYR